MSPLVGVPDFHFIMNRDVIRMLCVCGAICGGAACVWYWSGRDGESGAERRTVAGRGGRGGGGEGESGGNNQSDKHMNESENEFRDRMAVASRVIGIEDGLLHRLSGGVDFEGPYVGRYGDADLARVLPVISREEWVFLCVCELRMMVQSDHAFWCNAWQGYLLRDYLREVGIGNWADLFEKFHPFERRRDEIEGQRQEGKITEDECYALLGPIAIEMNTMEEEADPYDFDLVERLLLEYAVKHGFGDVAADGGGEEEEEGDGRRK